MIARIIAQARLKQRTPLRTFSNCDCLNLYLPRFIINLVSGPVYTTKATTLPEFSRDDPQCRKELMSTLWLVNSPSMSASIFPCHEYSSFIGFMACTFKTGFEAFFLASNIFSKFQATCLHWTFGFKFLSPSRATVLTKHSFFSF